MSRSTSRPRSSRPAARRSPRSDKSWWACDFAARSSRRRTRTIPGALEPQVLRRGADDSRDGGAERGEPAAARQITELKGITEPGKKYFHRDGFTLDVDLAIAAAITKAHV
eukprot:6199229-Pleurochrysis_carterae.AAC.2